MQRARGEGTDDVAGRPRRRSMPWRWIGAGLAVVALFVAGHLHAVASQTTLAP